MMDNQEQERNSRLITAKIQHVGKLKYISCGEFSDDVTTTWVDIPRLSEDYDECNVYGNRHER